MGMFDEIVCEYQTDVTTKRKHKPHWYRRNISECPPAMPAARNPQTKVTA